MMDKKEYGKKYREKHKDYFRKYQIEYRKKKKIKEKRKIEGKERYNKIKDLENYKEKHRRLNSTYSKNNPEKIKARSIANNKLTISKSQLCEKCEKKLATEKHHPDYNQPLIIENLCRKCHIQVHGGD